MLDFELQKRELPPLFEGAAPSKEDWEDRRAELLVILQEEIYGFTPPPPQKITGEVTLTNERFAAGKVTEQEIMLTFDTPRGDYSFPFQLYLPKSALPCPLILHLAFEPAPHRYIPVEEITDSGFGLAVVPYQGIVKDTHDSNFDHGLGAMFRDKGKRSLHEWGRIGMWAYGASRVLDYLLTLRDLIDPSKISVMGHSRLGKTALWTGAQDRRFHCAVSNNSGFGGAALIKHGSGEKVRDFIRVGSIDWYCEKFKSYVDLEDNLPYDHHFLLACIAPNLLYVASAEEDRGADPISEFLCCYEASKAYTPYGLKGLITPDNYPPAPTSMHKGQIGYHIRKGLHYLSRYDWNEFLSFLKLKV